MLYRNQILFVLFAIVLKLRKEIELKDLGNRIREIRQSKGLTQEELASIIIKDQQSIQRLEKGNVNPTYVYLLEVCDGLDISLATLFEKRV